MRCPSCHRVERWRGASREVVMPGGARRPDGAPERRAWEVVRAARQGATGPVVASCPACGQPMVAEAAGPPSIPWTFRLPQGELLVGERILGPGGETTEAQAEALIEAAWPEGFRLSEVRPGLALFQGGLLAMMAVPLVLWGVAVTVVVIFLAYFGYSPDI